MNHQLNEAGLHLRAEGQRDAVKDLDGPGQVGGGKSGGEPVDGIGQPGLQGVGPLGGRLRSPPTHIGVEPAVHGVVVPPSTAT